jgi:hypothetical protein
MNSQTTPKLLTFFLAVLLVLPSAMAQRSGTDKPVRSKTQTTEEAPVKPSKSSTRPAEESTIPSKVPASQETTVRPSKGRGQDMEQGTEATAEEPAEDLDALTTAEQCRAYAENKARWVDEQVGGLEPAQRKSVYDIFNKAYLDIRDLRKANMDTPKAELKDQAQDRLSQAKRDAIEVLSPEQQAQLDGWRDDRNPSRKDQAMQRAEAETRSLHNLVNLNESQRQEVLELNTQLWKEGQAWRDSNPDASPEDKKAYKREMQRKRAEGYRSILDAEQREAYKASLKGGERDR